MKRVIDFWGIVKGYIIVDGDIVVIDEFFIRIFVIYNKFIRFGIKYIISGIYIFVVVEVIVVKEIMVDIDFFVVIEYIGFVVFDIWEVYGIEVGYCYWFKEKELVG